MFDFSVVDEMAEAQRQLQMFDGGDLMIAPRARAKGPATSKAAAERHTASGRGMTNSTRVLAAVGKWPGLTSREISDRIGLERHEVASRLSDAKKAGRVRQGQQRACTINGSLAVTWWPT